MIKNKKWMLVLFAFQSFFLASGKMFAATTKVSCGNVTDIPEKIPQLTSSAINIIQVIVPVGLVIMGSIDFFKNLTAQKEDEMKKGQQIFIKRLILAMIIFLVFAIVKIFISLVANSNSSTIIECMECFINGVSNCK